MNDKFNLTALALRQRQLSWFFIALIAIAGVTSYFKLGQREDPDFTFRSMVVRTLWPGATTSQVDEEITKRIVKKLQEIPYYKEAFSYSRNGESMVILRLYDTAPPKQVPEIWYQVRKKIDDIRHTLPTGIKGPMFNDEFGDTNLLVVKPEEGRSLARALGRHAAVLMNNHGATVVGRDLRELVRDMMEPMPEPLPPLTPRERKIAALQRFLACITLARERMAP